MLTTILRPPHFPTAPPGADMSYLVADGVYQQPLSPHINNQLPDFVRSDYPKFVAFIEAYYEWMEQKDNPYGRTQFLMELADIDETLEAFIDYFKSKYLLNFPASLAVTSTGEMVDERTLMKNIKGFYKAKGTEKSFEFLFRILYDSEIEIYYPRSDILKISDGRWIEKKSLKLTSTNGNDNKYMNTRVIVQRNKNTGQIETYADVNSVIQYREGVFDITEVFLDDIVGVFDYGYDAYVEVDVLDGRTLKEMVYGVFHTVRITNGGTGYNIGDEVFVDDMTEGINLTHGGRGEVVSIDSDGKILTVEIQNHGVNFLEELPLTFLSISGKGATGVVVPNSLIEYPGYFSDNSGMLSSNKKLQDGFYYQDFSYVIKSEVSLQKFKDSVKKLAHPAGMKLFGDISIFTKTENDNVTHCEYQGYERPVIAHYTPYAFKTTSNVNAHDNNVAPPEGGDTNDANRYPAGFNPGSTADFHNWGGTGGKIKIYGEGLLENSFNVGDGITGHSSGSTAQVFEWLLDEDGTTSGTLYLMNLSGNFDSSDLIAGPHVNGATAGITAGITPDINGNVFFKGRGIVIEGGITAHDHQGLPIGTAGADGFTAAATRGMTVWGIHNHPNVRGIYGIGGKTGDSASLTGHGISMGSVALESFFVMPWDYHFHSSPLQITNWSGDLTGPYYGTEGDNNEYSYEYR